MLDKIELLCYNLNMFDKDKVTEEVNRIFGIENADVSIKVLGRLVEVDIYNIKDDCIAFSQLSELRELLDVADIGISIATDYDRTVTFKLAAVK